MTRRCKKQFDRLMIRKRQGSRLRDIFSYMRGGDPRDEWEFRVGAATCRFVNGWRSGAALFIDGVEVARTDKLISVRADKPVVTAEVTTGVGTTSRVDIYVRAISSVTIHVRVNDVPIQDGFV
jgi:hypothetical protein